jgi:hypothetical protein
VAGGHIVRNLGLLRRVRAARKTQGIFPAKYLCEIPYFCNIFCSASEVPA